MVLTYKNGQVLGGCLIQSLACFHPKHVGKLVFIRGKYMFYWEGKWGKAIPNRKKWYITNVYKICFKDSYVI